MNAKGQIAFLCSRIYYWRIKKPSLSTAYFFSFSSPSPKRNLMPEKNEDKGLCLRRHPISFPNFYGSGKFHCFTHKLLLFLSDFRYFGTKSIANHNFLEKMTLELRTISIQHRSTKHGLTDSYQNRFFFHFPIFPIFSSSVQVFPV